MTIPSITPPPATPIRSNYSSDAAYSAAVDVWMAWWATQPDEYNAFAPALVDAATGFYAATSTTSLTIGTGSKAFTIETGKRFAIGQVVKATKSDDPAKFMVGAVTAADATTGALTILVASGDTGGTGTVATWTVALTGATGATGATGENYTSASTTSLAIATGTKVFAADVGKPFAVGQWMIATSAANSANYMIGRITAYNSGTGSLTLNVTKTGGSGTFADWIISPTGEPATTSGSPWTQIATTSASGATVTFSSIPSTYEDLLLVFEGVSHNNGATQALQLDASNNGTNWATFLCMVVSAMAASDTIYGSALIPAYRKGAGSCFTTGISASANNTAGVSTSFPGAWRIAGGIQHLRAAWSAGNFDAGTVTLYGKA